VRSQPATPAMAGCAPGIGRDIRTYRRRTPATGPQDGNQYFLRGAVIAAFMAGMLALFAPCCISVMLPAYFASSFQNHRKLVAMSFVFAAGVATIILPLVMGAVALRQLFVSRHLFVYLAGGLVMIGMAGFTLLGGKLQLPIPGRRATTHAGPLGIYSLGMFSGVASSCCAPVLAGVIALSSVAPSVALAMGLGGRTCSAWWRHCSSFRCCGIESTGGRADCFARGISRGGLVRCNVHCQRRCSQAGCCSP